MLPGPRAPGAPCTYRLRGHHLVDALLILLGQDGELPCLLVLQALQNCLVLTLWSYFQLVILQCFVLLSLHFACVLELLFDLHFHSLPRKERREECEGLWEWRGTSTWMGCWEPQLPCTPLHVLPTGMNQQHQLRPCCSLAKNRTHSLPSSAQGTSTLCPCFLQITQPTTCLPKRICFFTASFPFHFLPTSTLHYVEAADLRTSEGVTE